MEGSVVASTKPPLEPTKTGETRTFPSGRRIETLSEQQSEDPTETPVTSRLTRCPAVPAKVTAAFWPGTVVATVDDPPAASAAVASAGTS